MKISNIVKYRVISNIVKFSFVFIIALAFVSPIFADPFPCKSLNPNLPKGCTDTGDLKGDTGDLKGDTGDLKGDTGVKINTGIKNPISGIDDIPSFIVTILNFVLMVAIPIITLAIIYSGFLFVTAAGNSEKLGKAKKTLMYTLIGATLLLGSYVITQAIKGTVDEIRKTSSS